MTKSALYSRYFDALCAVRANPRIIVVSDIRSPLIEAMSCDAHCGPCLSAAVAVLFTPAHTLLHIESENTGTHIPRWIAIVDYCGEGIPLFEKLDEDVLPRFLEVKANISGRVEFCHEVRGCRGKSQNVT